MIISFVLTAARKGRTMNDVVYILRSSIGMDTDELRYSIRSVVANFPYRRIVFAGGRPSDLIPDYGIYHEQQGNSAWERVDYSIERICKDPEVSDDFWLFNDDYFIMAPYDGAEVMRGNGSLLARVGEIVRRHGMESPYSRLLVDTNWILEDNGETTADYTLHVPMLVNKRKALEVLHRFGKGHDFNNLYGNVAYQRKGKVMGDVKVYDMDSAPDWPLLSTVEDTFRRGEVGRKIRDMFIKPSRYEVRL